ncbi:hypothetical protein SAMN04490186_3691 [Pseudomonas grimontii]|jgi:hypothetical protein|uniref:Uncharacterized protein n=1 Tax=Pseudomonas grimontii TaxID=129847 RepID=A0ABY0TNN6_9PSED|nr:hypothetical protein SAMN04490186_3691 [Pseudomonas grimontii]
MCAQDPQIIDIEADSRIGLGQKIQLLEKNGLYPVTHC